MKTISPRSLVFGGRVIAGALWFDRGLLGETEARRRVLETMDRAREVFDVGGGYLVLLERPAPLVAERCPGSPVVEHDGRWLTAPLRAQELPPDAPKASVVRVRGGRVDVLPLDTATVVDAAAWLDVDDWTLVPTESLGIVPPAARPTLLVKPEPGDIVTLLGDRLPARDPQREQLLAALAEPRAAASKPAGSGLLDAISAWLDRTFGGNPPTTALPPRGSSSSATTPSTTAAASPSPPPAPGPLRRWLARLAARSALGQLIGRRQAEYLERTLRHFEDGRLDDALRHAIPFSSLPGPPKPPSLSVPSPRDALHLSASRTPGATSSMILGDDLYARFKELYARAARQLEEQGRIEEAAYVLFELLGQDEEGIALLERHERYALAAAMAEGHGHPPGRVIRLWFLAGDAARAIVIARRTGAFADAIERLERREPQLALRLRLLWADRLAGAGEYAAAVEAVRSVPQARSLIRTWVDRAIALGGFAANSMLPLKLELWPEDPAAHDEVREVVQALLASDDDDAPALRRALGSAWAEQGRGAPVWGPLASDITRQLLVDAGRHGLGGPPEPLIRVLDDPVLRHDISGLTSPRTRAPPPRSPIIDRHERGLVALEDAVLLPSGRYLLALGEAGMRLVDARGKTLRGYEHPAFDLVMADSGAQVIALYRRGQTWTLRRVDLATGRAEVWCDARFDRFARSYDGAGWYLTSGDALVLVDAQGPGFEALWRVGGLPSPPAALARSRTHLSLVLAPPGRALVEVWTYELTDSGPALRERRPVELPRAVGADLHLSVEARGTLLGHDQSTVFVFRPDGVNAQARMTLGDAIVTRSDDALLVRANAQGMLLHRLPYETLVPDSPMLDLRGTHSISTHDDPRGRTIVADDRGRVITLDAQGTIERFVRV